MSAVLELRNVTKAFPVKRGVTGVFSKPEDVVVVDNVNLSLHRKKVLGLVGESGSGKSTCGLMALRLLDVTSGQILIDGNDISQLGTMDMIPYRKDIQIVFQDSYSSLNPMMTISEIVGEPFVIHRLYDRAERLERVAELLEMVGLDRGYRGRYPHELSGGQRQRVSIARALALGPRILVADEPTSALDVSVKAQIMNLLHDLQEKMDLSILFISHELNVIRSLADEIVVMYRGRIVEQAATETLFSNALHPYTRSLLDAIPSLDPREKRRRSFVTPDDIARNLVEFSSDDVTASNVETRDGTMMFQVSEDHFVEGRLRRGDRS